MGLLSDAASAPPRGDGRGAGGRARQAVRHGLPQVDHAIKELKPDSFKGYTIGDNTNKVCVHKGLFPPSVEKQFPHLLAHSDVRDVGKAAKDWPKLRFIVYRAALATDRIATLKAEYEKAGGSRSNVRYGYVAPSGG